jgi:hypothetical protein
MLDFRFSWLPFVLVAVANFILSWLYYSPAVPWFKAWQKGIGMDPGKREMTEEDRRAMPRLMGGAAIATLLFSYGLQVLVHSVKAETFLQGALVGFLAWVAFSVTHSLNTQFEGRRPIVLVINNALYLLTYGCFGGLVAVLGR